MTDAPRRRQDGSNQRRGSGSSARATGATGRGSRGSRSGSGREGREDRGSRSDGFGPFPTDDRDERTRQRRHPPEHDDATDAVEARRTRAGRRPALRTVGERRPAARGGAPVRTRGRSSTAPAKRRRRRTGPADVEVEIRRLAGRDGDRFLRRLMDAADAFAHDRERDALRILRPLREKIPDSPSVRELAGLSHYRLGNYAAAAKELEAYRELSGAADQNPVLMDCYRAQRRWRKVDDAWQELAEASPSAEAVAEGRIVQAGALADQGRMADALQVLRKRAPNVRNPKEHHLRLWYALADLEERAGNLAVARDLFDRVRRADPGYADVAERLAALG